MPQPKHYQTSNKDDWETPWWMIEKLESMVGHQFEYDAACTAYNCKAKKPIGDGLVAPWPDKTFCNPPYGGAGGKTYFAWVAKALKTPHRAVLLVKANTDTRAFQLLLNDPRVQVWFVPGRIRFEIQGVPQGSPPFASAVAFINYDREICTN